MSPPSVRSSLELLSSRMRRYLSDLNTGSPRTRSGHSSHGNGMGGAVAHLGMPSRSALSLDCSLDCSLTALWMRTAARSRCIFCWSRCKHRFTNSKRSASHWRLASESSFAKSAFTWVEVGLG